jgi:hypothetical protein
MGIFESMRPKGEKVTLHLRGVGSEKDEKPGGDM